MVAGFNKWFLASLIPFFLMLNGENRLVKPEITSQARPHPLHLSVTEIEHNSAEKTLEISCKLFTDDFENILEKNYKTNVDLINPPDRVAIQKLINSYIQQHLQIKADGKPIPFSCIGFERDHEATFSYFQATAIPAVTTIELNSTLMYDLFDDQTNIIHVTVGGKRKSTKLNYPAKETSVGF